MSRQKYDTTAASVPICMTAVNAAPGSCQPNSAGTIFKCAVLLIGMNSVSPCTIANTMISSHVINTAFSRKRAGASVIV